MAFAKHLGLKNFYERYVERAKAKDREYKDYKTFAKVVKVFNEKLRYQIVYKSEIVTLPYNLGNLYIKKFKNNYTEENKYLWRVDYIESKKQGKIVYFGDKFGYRFTWDKKFCKIKGRRWFKFKPCRKASRMIADAIKNKNVDYYN